MAEHSIDPNIEARYRSVALGCIKLAECEEELELQRALVLVSVSRHAPFALLLGGWQHDLDDFSGRCATDTATEDL